VVSIRIHVAQSYLPALTSRSYYWKHVNAGESGSAVLRKATIAYSGIFILNGEIAYHVAV
jgi:hypothetical protein